MPPRKLAAAAPNFLDPKTTRVRTGADGRLTLEIGFEERHAPVRAVRCLPLNRPFEYLSLQDDDGEEIGIVRDTRDLDAASRAALEAELQFFYLKSRVTGIRKVENKNGILSWDIDTDRGSRTIHIRDRQNIRALPDGRTMVTDIHQAKYEIPPLAELDERSRQLLETEL